MELIERRRAIRAITACDGKSSQIEALEKMPAVKKNRAEGNVSMFPLFRSSGKLGQRL